MIKSRADYHAYLEADRISLNMQRRRPRLAGDYIWKYQRMLRRLEYLQNCRSGLIYRPLYYWVLLRFKQKGAKYGFSLHPNQFGPGLSIAHIGPVIVNAGARIGKNCRIHAGVNIGVQAGGPDEAVPHIGDNVYIGPGAKIFGSIAIASGIAIGANAVVNKSFEEENITIGGIPARKISEKGAADLLYMGAE